MKSIVAIAALLFALHHAPAVSAGGLNLYWDGCSDGGTMLKTFACNSNSGAVVLYASVIIPADMPQFAATTVIIDVMFDVQSVPSWWQLAAGQCRANAVSVSFDRNNFLTNCDDLWAGAVPLQVFQVQNGVYGLPNQIRFNSGAALPSGEEISRVADGSELVAARFTILRTKSVGTGSCSGCIVGACLEFREALLQQPVPGPAYRVTNPASNTLATWNHNSGYLYCGGVWDAARNSTWGRVKTSYR